MLPIVPAARWSCYAVRAHGGARDTGRRPGQPASNTAWSRSAQPTPGRVARSSWAGLGLLSRRPRRARMT